MHQVSEGDMVCIHYVGRLSDGTVFDSSEGSEPFEFTAGGEDVIAGISLAVVGMKQGEKKTVSVPTEKGYGLRNPNLEYQVPRDSLASEVQLGDELRVEVEGQPVQVWIREINEDFAVVDGNHPLAGQALVFDIELLAILSE